MSEEEKRPQEGEHSEAEKADVEQMREEIARRLAKLEGREEEPEEDGKKKKSVGREILEWIITIAAAVVMALVIRTFIFEPVRVDGQSMINTLQDGEFMFVTKYNYLFSDPERFDVVICRYPERGNTNFVKRVVGIPGDTVEMKEGVLYVNGEAVEEDYIDNKATYTMQAVTLGEDEYFVLGDNRPHSNDSHLIGPLSRDMIKGEVRFVFFPFSQWRMVE